jgi:hypothetical protein
MMSRQRLRVSSETVREISDRTTASLSLGEGDTVVRLLPSLPFLTYGHLACR